VAAAELGAKAGYHRTDVTSEDGVTTTLRQATERMGGLNVAINCAGILRCRPRARQAGPMPLKNFQTTVMVNLIGSFNVGQGRGRIDAGECARRDGERGVIVNTASIAAYEGQIGQAAYSASKGGVIGMTLPMAREFARIGVRVMTVAPAYSTHRWSIACRRQYTIHFVHKYPFRRVWVLPRSSPAPSRSFCKTAISMAGDSRRRRHPLGTEMKASEIKKAIVVEYIAKSGRSRHRAQFATRAWRQRHVPFFNVQRARRLKLDLSLRADDELKETELIRRAVTYSYMDGESFVFMDYRDYRPIPAWPRRGRRRRRLHYRGAGKLLCTADRRSARSRCKLPADGDARSRRHRART